MFFGVRGERSLWGFTGLKPIARIVALDNEGEHLFYEHLFDFLELWIFHALPPSPLDLSIIPR